MIETTNSTISNEMSVEVLLNSLLGIFEIQQIDTSYEKMKKRESMSKSVSPLSCTSCRSSSDNETACTSSMTVVDDDLSLHSRKDISAKMGRSQSLIGLDHIIQTRKEKFSLASNVVHIENSTDRNITDVYDGVHDGPVLGTGASGIVRGVTHRVTGISYAVKCLDLGLLVCSNSLEQLRQEIYIMCQLDHPNIVRLVEVYEAGTEIYLVQELCSGGELFDALEEQPEYRYTEMRAQRYVRQMISAVRYIHSKGIIHRDLKLENFLFSSKEEDSELKLIDFGLSKYFRKGEYQNEPVGSPYSVAPEVILGEYDERSDVWAIGVITYLLLCGDPPFGGCGDDIPLLDVRDNILTGNFDFENNDAWFYVSDRAKHFIESILVTDPQARPSIDEVLRLPWLNSKKSRKHGSCLSVKVIDSMVRYRSVDSLRRYFREIVSFTLCPHQIKQLRQEFAKIELGSGEICFKSLRKEIQKSLKAHGRDLMSEKQIEEVFNALRLHKSDESVNWHEFIAAELSLCSVDERNLRLAFDMLDSEHKGFICTNNFLDILGCEAHGAEEYYSKIFYEGLLEVGVGNGILLYDDFLRLMK